MKNQPDKQDLLLAIILFIGMPILFYATGNFPRRTLLKESISLLTIVSLCLLLAQFFLTRSGNSLLLRYSMAKVIKVHKIIGYVLICIFLVHPFLIVLPRYFEAGVEPADALITLLRTYSNPAVLNGILAWLLLFILLSTALLREKIPLIYKTWTTVHKWLAIAFIIFACWHAIALGRHTDGVLSVYVVILSLCGIILLFRDHILQIVSKSGISSPKKLEIRH